DIIDNYAETQPDNTAVHAVDRSLTYAQLKVESDNIASHIRRHQLPHGSHVVVALERKAHLITSMIAIWKAGHAYIPIDPTYPSQRIEMIFEDAEVGLILTQSDLANQFPSTVQRMLLDKIDLNESDSNLASSHIDPTDLAYVIFTSGSTGRPKGVMIP